MRSYQTTARQRSDEIIARPKTIRIQNCAFHFTLVEINLFFHPLQQHGFSVSTRADQNDILPGAAAVFQTVKYQPDFRFFFFATSQDRRNFSRAGLEV